MTEGIALSTPNYPENLSGKMLKAVKLVCEQGYSRSLAAHEAGVKAVELGVVIASNGLRRAPPPAVQKAMAMVARGRTVDDAERLAATGDGRVKYWMAKMAGGPKSGRTIEAVRHGIEHGLTMMETAQKFGLCYGSVARVSAQMGVKFPKHPRFNSMIGSQRDRDVYDMVKAGNSYRKVGKQFSISYERVRQICVRVEEMK